MKLKEKVKFVKRPDKFFIFSVEKGDLFETNQIGSFIIEKIEEGKSEKEIIDVLQKKTGIDKKIISKDVKNFIKKLKEKGFIE
jgi:hypothetical protein